MPSKQTFFLTVYTVLDVRYLIYCLSSMVFFLFLLFYYRHFHRQFYVPRARSRDRIQSACVCMYRTRVSHNSNMALSIHYYPFSEGTVSFYSFILFIYMHFFF